MIVAGIQRRLHPQPERPPTRGDRTAKGALVQPVPTAGAGRRSASTRYNGSMHVNRISFSGTWKGTGQRRPLDGREPAAAGNQTILFTPAWGSADADLAPTRLATSSSSASRPRATGTDLTATVATVRHRLGRDSARRRRHRRHRRRTLRSSPTRAPPARRGRRRADPSVDAWKPASPPRSAAGRSSSKYGSRLRHGRELRRRPAQRPPAAGGVGQLADGRIILVDSRRGQPGYSVGMTTYELAQTMAGLGR